MCKFNYVVLESLWLLDYRLTFHQNDPLRQSSVGVNKETLTEVLENANTSMTCESSQEVWQTLRLGSLVGGSHNGGVAVKLSLQYGKKLEKFKHAFKELYKLESEIFTVWNCKRKEELQTNVTFCNQNKPFLPLFV